jgi:hypothetical protein
MELLFLVFFANVQKLRSSRLQRAAAAAASKAKSSMPATMK